MLIRQSWGLEREMESLLWEGSLLGCMQTTLKELPRDTT